MGFLGRFDALELLFGTYRGGLESLGSIGFELIKICEFLVAACEEPEFRLSIRNSGWGVQNFPEPEFRLGNRSAGWGIFRTRVFPRFYVLRGIAMLFIDRETFSS